MQISPIAKFNTVHSAYGTKKHENDTTKISENNSQVSFGRLNFRGRGNSHPLDKNSFKTFEDAVSFLRKKETGLCIKQGKKYTKITQEAFNQLEKDKVDSVILRLPKESSVPKSWFKKNVTSSTGEFTGRQGISPKQILEFLKKGIKEAIFLMDDGLQKLQLPSLDSNQAKMTEEMISQTKEFVSNKAGKDGLILPEYRPEYLFKESKNMLETLALKDCKLEKISY